MAKILPNARVVQLLTELIFEPNQTKQQLADKIRKVIPTDGMLRIHKDGGSKVPMIEFINIDVSNNKDLLLRDTDASEFKRLRAAIEQLTIAERELLDYQNRLSCYYNVHGKRMDDEETITSTQYQLHSKIAHLRSEVDRLKRE